MAAMCHGDDPNKPVKPKPTINEAFPDLIIPKNKSGQCELNRKIHFRLVGCRAINIQQKFQQAREMSNANLNNVNPTSEQNCSKDAVAINSTHHLQHHPQQQHDIIIARRRLLKPLSNEKRFKNTSNFYCIQI